MMGQRTAFSLFELITVVLIITVLSAVTARRAFEDHRRDEPDHAREELKAIASALDAYRQAHGVYPSNLKDVQLDGPDRNLFRIWVPTESVLSYPWLLSVACILFIGVIAFDIGYQFKTKSKRRWLLIPGYIGVVSLSVIMVNWSQPAGSYRGRAEHEMPSDFAYRYRTDGKTGFVLQAAGVNEKRDLEDLGKTPLANPDAANQFLLPYTYDPTNGIGSAGDIFHIEFKNQT
ncbi:MAG: hypothetical protein ABFD69_12155 [Candidatus Sumerlaeia bacterium]